MSQTTGLPSELKVTFLFALLALLLVIFFVIIAIVVYSRKQKSLLTEKRLKESEFEKNLLAKELEKVKSLQLERERISQDMHDDIGSSLSSIKLQAALIKKKIDDPQLLEDINFIIQDAQTINHSMREMIWSLQSQHDYVGSFIDYIEQYARYFFAKTSIQFQMDSHIHQADLPLSAEIRRNLFLVIKEALHNALKHSQATKVSLHCSQINPFLELIIQDNGIGLQADQVEQNLHGNGLINMRNRMKSINGNFEMKSSIKGTSIVLKVQL